MFLDKLSILNYKNIAEAQLTFSPKLNCFIGHNGEGKTNLLDAVYYLSFCRSSCSVPDSQVMRHDSDFFMLDGRYISDSGEDELVTCGMKRGSKDTVLIDGVSEERRRLMDVVISQCDSAYLDALNRYNKALQQRNSMLRAEAEPDTELMELWEEQMAAAGEEVYRKRDDFVNKLVPIFQHFYNGISRDREQVSLRYVSHCQRGPLLDVIRRDRHKDRAVGYSLHGIHRDDLEMLIGDYPIRREGSQGQNKTFVVSLKLAQFEFLKSIRADVRPILLLDDIFDKLDANRVEQIVRIVGGDSFGQIFLTDTNREHLDRILSGSSLDYKLFYVENGEITLKEDWDV